MRKKADSYPEILQRGIFTIFLLVLCAANSGWAQTKTYLSGHVTGRRVDPGLLPGTEGLTAPMTLSGGFYRGIGVLTGATIDSTKLTAQTTLGIDLGGASIKTVGGNVYIQFRTTGYLHLPKTRPVYFTLRSPPLATNLSVPVGGLLSLGSNSFIEGSFYRRSSAIVGGMENVGDILTGSTTAQIVIDKGGKYYCRIVSSNTIDSFNSARLKLKLPADAVLGLTVANTVSAFVHNAFYLSSPGATCNINPMFVTRGEVNGISLDLGSVLSGLSLDTIIASPQSAIDSNSATFCSFQSGLLSLGALSNVSQSYLFDHTTTAGDGLRLQLSVPSTLLSVALLNNITVGFYRNDTLQSTDTLGKRLLGLDLLTLPLLSGGYRSIDAILRTTSTFDRVTLNLGGGILSLSLLGSGVRVHEVSIAPAAPSIAIQPANQNICRGQSANLTVTAAGGTSYQWQSLVTGAWSNIGGATAISYTPVALPSMDSTYYRVRITGGVAGCPQTVSSNQALLRVKPVPSIPAVTFGP